MWVGRLATVYLNDGRLDTAMPLYEEALKLRKANLGPEHPDTLGARPRRIYATVDAHPLPP